MSSNYDELIVRLCALSGGGRSSSRVDVSTFLFNFNSNAEESGLLIGDKKKKPHTPRGGGANVGRPTSFVLPRRSWMKKWVGAQHAEMSNDCDLFPRRLLPISMAIRTRGPRHSRLSIAMETDGRISGSHAGVLVKRSFQCANPTEG